MVVGMSDGSLVTFIVEGFKFEVSITQKLQTAPVSALLACAASPSDALYAGTLDGDVILYKDDAECKFKAEQQRNLMGNPVSCLAACPAGVAVSLLNGQISLLHPLTLHPLLDVSAHARSIYAMFPLDGGRKLVNAGLDTAIHVWTFAESSGQPAEMFLSQTLHLPNWFEHCSRLLRPQPRTPDTHVSRPAAACLQVLRPWAPAARLSPALLTRNISKCGGR